MRYPNMLGNIGLTLVELMIVMVLSLVLMGAVYLAFQIQHKSSIVQSNVLEAQQDIRAVMDVMERDIREAGCNPHDPKIPDLVGISNTSGTFFSSTRLVLLMDRNGDEVVENISYVWTPSNCTLTRNGQNLADNISNLAFTYTSGGTDLTPVVGSNLGTTNAAKVRTIRIDLRARYYDQDANAYRTREFIRNVRGRNLGL